MIAKCIGFTILAYLAFAVFLALVDSRPGGSTNLTSEQTIEARRLASQTLVTHKDGSVTPLDLESAKMMVETCAALRRTKFSDMTPGMLSLWNTCQTKVETK